MQVYTAEQAAKLLQITTATLLVYVRTGIISGSKVARKWRFTDRDMSGSWSSSVPPLKP